MRETILQIGPLMEATSLELNATHDIKCYWEASDKDALLDSIADTCRAVVTDGGKGVPTAVLERLPNVKIISVYGVGVDAIDLDYCKKAGIAVGNTPDVLSDDVADLAVALALASCRQLVTGDQYARKALWKKNGAMPLTTRMMGKAAGIYGMGSIGDCLAKRLNAFDMPVSYCNRNKKADSPYKFVESLEQLASESDFLFITAAATSGTIGAIDKAVLDALGPNGYLINVSRGTLVDEPVLVEYLSNNKIAGAGLDVFHDEPNIPPAMFDMDNVVLQPHNASGTHETRKAMGDLMIENLNNFLQNRPLTKQVV